MSSDFRQETGWPEGNYIYQTKLAVFLPVSFGQFLFQSRIKLRFARSSANWENSASANKCRLSALLFHQSYLGVLLLLNSNDDKQENDWAFVGGVGGVCGCGGL